MVSICSFFHLLCPTLPSAVRHQKGCGAKICDTLFCVTLVLNDLLVHVHLMLWNRPCETWVVGCYNHIGCACAGETAEVALLRGCHERIPLCQRLRSMRWNPRKRAHEYACSGFQS